MSAAQVDTKSASIPSCGGGKYESVGDLEEVSVWDRQALALTCGDACSQNIGFMPGWTGQPMSCGMG